MCNCYVSVLFERQPNLDEVVETKGEKKARIEHKKRGSAEQAKRYMYSHYLSLSVLMII